MAASNLYETLEVFRDATPEQIRKAYKKKALQTHPDRLPPNATKEEKSASEEQFRKVNNAYEILSDPQNRKAYDLHGVWPPPQPSDMPRRNDPHTQAHHRHHTVPVDPFLADYLHAFSSFAFSDPFNLFDSVFGMDPHHRHAFQQHRHSHHGHFMAEDPFESLEADMGDFFDMRPGSGGLFRDGLISPFHHPGFPCIGMPFRPMLAGPSFSDSSNWVGESFTTTTVNGVTQTIHKKRDWDGNEHVTRTYADGRKIHTINGIEQPPENLGYQPYPQVEGRQDVRSSRPRVYRMTSSNPPPPLPYPRHPPGGYETSPAVGSSRTWFHDPHYSEATHYSDSRPVIPDMVPQFGLQREERSHRRRWWPGRG